MVNKLKYAINDFPFENRIKVGHAGTLDPLATGLLVVCTGKCTKQISEIQDGKKTYRGIIRLGGTTPSFDLETKIDQTFPVKHITEEMLIEATKKFTGVISQVPPIYSAVRIKGKKAYEHARKGNRIEMKSREVFIESFTIKKFTNADVHFELICGKGTYVRSLAHELGKILESGAHLIELERTRVGPYALENAIHPEQFRTFLEKHLNTT